MSALTWTSFGRPLWCCNRTGCPPRPSSTAPCWQPPRSPPTWCQRAADRRDNRSSPASNKRAESTRWRPGRRRPADVPATEWLGSTRFSIWNERAAEWWNCRCRSTHSQRPGWSFCSATGTPWHCGSCSAHIPTYRESSVLLLKAFHCKIRQTETKLAINALTLSLFVLSLFLVYMCSHCVFTKFTWCW